MTTLGLFTAGHTELALSGFNANEVTYVIIAFSVGTLNNAFLKNCEVSIPLS